MKKIFTLIAVAAMAMSVNAQDVFIPTNGKTYTALEEASTANCKIVMGDDTYAETSLKSHKAYILSTGLSKQVEIEGEMKDRYILLSGKNNPYSGPSDAKVFYSPENKTLPEKGCYYMITPSKAGKLMVGIVLNADKAFYVVKKSNGECLPVSAVKLTNDGATSSVETYGADYKTANKVTGTAEFDVDANETYYVFCNGSKLGFFGYVFTITDGINTVKAAETENGAAYNLAGQKVADSFKGVVIKNGKKMIQK